MELVPPHGSRCRGRLMAALPHIRALDPAARMMDADPARLEAIVRTDGALSHGTITPVGTRPEEATTARTDCGREDPADTIRDARAATESSHEFPMGFGNDTERLARILARSPPQHLFGCGRADGPRADVPYPCRLRCRCGHLRSGAADTEDGAAEAAILRLARRGITAG